MTARPSAWLVDDRFGKAYPLGDETTIGRGPRNTIILRDADVSRLHAEVRWEEHAFVVHAFGSSGTSVNGTPLGTSHPLREGDRIEIASTSLRFTHQPPAEDEAFVVPRDAPTPRDTLEVPTRASMRAAIVPSSKRRWTSWHWALVALVLLALAAFVFFSAAGRR